MSKKSVRALLHHAAELITIANIKRDEITCVCVFGSGWLTIQIKPLALARVFRLFALPKNTLRMVRSEKSVSLSFEYRGADWAACVTLEDADSAEWQDLLGPEPARIAQRPLALSYAEARA